jgi:2-amino-4-hydroxy-6-hydroxymethyldihydropteridine diphosphokinase
VAVVAVSLGSNLADRLKNLKAALEKLAALLEDFKASPVYETAPMYVLNQPNFLNAVALGEATLGPLAFLGRLKEIERELGREKTDRFGPRIIDLDIVYFGPMDYKYHDGKRTVLQIPHSRTPERRFVLQPLFDLAPDLKLPGLGSVRELLEQTREQAGDVRPFNDAVLSIPGKRQ